MGDAFTEYFGTILRTHGVDGTVVVGDLAGLRAALTRGARIGVGYSASFTRPLIVEDFEQHAQTARLRVRECSTPELAAGLIDQAIYLTNDQVQVIPDERFTVGDIEGCTVLDEHGTVLGVIEEVWLMPANDVWVMKTPQGRTIPLPVIDDVIRSVNTTERRIVAHVLPGLEDLDTTSDEDNDA